MDDKAAGTRVLTAHVPDDLAKRVDEYAARMERSRGWIVKQALTNWIAEEEEKYRLTLEASAEVDAGNLIDDDEVAIWIESLDTDNPLPLPQPRK